MGGYPPTNPFFIFHEINHPFLGYPPLNPSRFDPCCIQGYCFTSRRSLAGILGRVNYPFSELIIVILGHDRLRKWIVNSENG